MKGDIVIEIFAKEHIAIKLFAKEDIAIKILRTIFAREDIAIEVLQTTYVKADIAVKTFPKEHIVEEDIAIKLFAKEDIAIKIIRCSYVSLVCSRFLWFFFVLTPKTLNHSQLGLKRQVFLCLGSKTKKKLTLMTLFLNAMFICFFTVFSFSSVFLRSDPKTNKS